MMFIIADDRERPSGVLQWFEQHSESVEIRVKRLKIGDYLIPPVTIVERKTVDDFCMSLIDGRLFSQAYRLALNDCQPIMIVEGMWKERSVKVEGVAIRGALLTLAQTFRLPVVHTIDPEDTAGALVTLAKQGQRNNNQAGKLYGRRPKRSLRRKLYVLQALPGVGPQLAETMFKHFGSVRAVMTADYNELQKLPGLGPKRAARIADTISEDPAEYMSRL